MHYKKKSDFSIKVESLRKKYTNFKRTWKYSYGWSNKQKQIAKTLNSIRIKYITNYVLADLKNHDELFRITNFYLPKYNMYLEVFDKWKSIKEKVKYKKQINMFKLNNLRLTHIYPNDFKNRKNIIKLRLKIAYEKPIVSIDPESRPISNTHKSNKNFEKLCFNNKSMIY